MARAAPAEAAGFRAAAASATERSPVAGPVGPANVCRAPPSPLPDGETTDPLAPATVVVKLPADAKLYVDGVLVPQTTPTRSFDTPPLNPDPDRLSCDQFQQLRQSLQGTGLALHDGPAVEERLTELRGMYGPFVNALAHHLLFTLPPVVPEKPAVDNWQTSAWMRRAPGIGQLPAPDGDEHFD